MRNENDERKRRDEREDEPLRRSFRFILIAPRREKQRVRGGASPQQRIHASSQNVRSGGREAMRRSAKPEDGGANPPWSISTEEEIVSQDGREAKAVA